MTEIPVTRDPAKETVWGSAVVEERPSTGWGMVLALGVMTALFGLAVLVWPHASLKVLAFLVGVWLLLSGIVRIVGAFMPRGGPARQILSGIVGVVIFIGGVACLRNLANALAVVAFLIALTWLFSGLAEIVVGLQSTGPARILYLVLGGLSFAVGLVFLFAPGLSLAALVLMTGIGAIVIGAGEVVLALRLRSARV